MDRKGGGRLALFAYYYPPLGGAGSQRALSFARHLPDLGWEVTVFTPREGVYGTDPSLVGDGLPGVEVVRTSSLEVAALIRRWRPSAGGAAPEARYVEEASVGPVGETLRGLARRFLYFPDSARGWIGPAAEAAAAAHRREPFDLALSSSPPVSGHAAAHRFARGAGVPLVLDFRDLPWKAEDAPSPRLARLVRGILAEAAEVVTVSPACAAWMDGIGGGERARVVYNGFEPASPAAPAVPAAPVSRDILYAGSTYGDRQDMTAFLGLLERLRSAGDPWTLRLAGKIDAATRERMAPFRERGLVVEEGFLDRRRVQELHERAAVVLVWGWEGTDVTGRSQVPVKMFDAAASGRPVLLVTDPASDAAAVGRRLGLDSLAPGDLPAMERALRGVAAGGIPTGMRADPAGLAEFTRRAQAARLAEVLESAMARGPVA